MPVTVAKPGLAAHDLGPGRGRGVRRTDGSLGAPTDWDGLGTGNLLFFFSFRRRIDRATFVLAKLKKAKEEKNAVYEYD